MIVQLKDNTYLLIQNVRWAQLVGQWSKSWVYDGSVIEAPKVAEIHLATGMSGVLESDIKGIVV